MTSLLGLSSSSLPSSLWRFVLLICSVWLSTRSTTNAFLSPRITIHHVISSSSSSSVVLDSSQSEPEQQQQQRRFEGVVCLVTGASRGIGKGIALALGKEGATVYVTGTSSSTTTASASASSALPDKFVTNSEVGGPGTVEDTALAIDAAGGVGIPVVCNHADDEDVFRLFRRIQEEQDGKLDILVNNVFRVPPGGPQKLFNKFWEDGEDGSPRGMLDTWDVLHTVGLRSHYVASCCAVPLMLKSKASSNTKLPRPLIAMVSSFGGLTYTFNVPYGVGKAALDRMAKDMALELCSEDICVTSFWPGVVLTERTEAMVETGEWDRVVGIPLGNGLAESPEFAGRAIAEVAMDPKNLETKSGTYQVVAELAEEYGFTDVDGNRPPSIRSLRFLLPAYGMDEATREKVPSWLIPDWKLPFSIMAQGRPPERDSDEPRAV